MSCATTWQIPKLKISGTCSNVVCGQCEFCEKDFCIDYMAINCNKCTIYFYCKDLNDF